ncbi:MAG: hypothetical protein GT597_13920 [Bacteroidales bacterium]|nr:hypothetical protein [Bacteroidales bacterium]
MRRFALGCLGYTPERFARTIVGDLIDALTGFNQNESERIKSLAELMRMHLFLQITEHPQGRITAMELWPLPWDGKPQIKYEEISDEEREKINKFQADILNKIKPG